MDASVEAPSEHLPLGNAINIATRSVHTKLNKLILLRLPLSLPPHAFTPSLYVIGLLHVAPIYIAFETLWRNILEETPPLLPAEGQREPVGHACEPREPLLATGSQMNCPFPEGSDATVHKPLLCERIRTVLSHVYFPDLQRSARIRDDIHNLTGWPEHVVEEQLSTIERSGALGEFVSHIKRTVEKRPHVLLAYAWILYMALFSGGRFIRAALEAGGREFWSDLSDPVRPAEAPSVDRPLRAGDRTFEPPAATDQDTTFTPPPDSPKHDRDAKFFLRFFQFDAPQDGEPLKKEFKTRLSEMETLLTASERIGIVREAVSIFDNMLLLVSQLDSVCGTENTDGNLDALASLLSRQFGKPLVVDSAAVPKEVWLEVTEKQVSTAETTPEKAKGVLGVDGLEMPSNKADDSGSLHRLTDTLENENGTDRECCLRTLKAVHIEPILPLPSRITLRRTHSSSAGSDTGHDLCSAAEEQKHSRSLLPPSFTSKRILLAAATAAVVAFFYAQL